MGRRENEYVNDFVLDFNVHDLWQDFKICIKSRLGNFKDFGIVSILTAVPGSAGIPGIACTGASDRCDRRCNFYYHAT